MKILLLSVVFVNFILTGVYISNTSENLEIGPIPCGLGCQSSSQQQELHDIIISEATYITATNPEPEGMAINFIKGKQKVGDLYESRFKISNEDLCHNNGTDLKVLILVTSATAYVNNRQMIRLT